MLYISMHGSHYLEDCELELGDIRLHNLKDDWLPVDDLQIIIMKAEFLWLWSRSLGLRKLFGLDAPLDEQLRLPGSSTHHDHLLPLADSEAQEEGQKWLTKN